jgi:hypothetical protein
VLFESISNVCHGNCQDFIFRADMQISKDIDYGSFAFAENAEEGVLLDGMAIRNIIAILLLIELGHNVKGEIGSIHGGVLAVGCFGVNGIFCPLNKSRSNFFAADFGFRKLIDESVLVPEPENHLFGFLCGWCFHRVKFYQVSVLQSTGFFGVGQFNKKIRFMFSCLVSVNLCKKTNV